MIGRAEQELLLRRTEQRTRSEEASRKAARIRGPEVDELDGTMLSDGQREHSVPNALAVCAKHEDEPRDATSNQLIKHVADKWL